MRLEDVDNWSGLNRTRRAGPVRYDPIWMEGPHRLDGDGKLDKNSAFSRIGRPARRAGYPCKVLRVTYRDGGIDEVGVFPKSNQFQPGSVGHGEIQG